MVLPKTFVSFASLLTISLVHAQESVQDFNPLTDFCRRFAHRTAVIDNKLFIDGGYVDYGGSVYPDTINYTNTYLLYTDLDTIANQFPVEYANLSKPSDVPSLAGGVLWADTVNKYIYLYGGEYNWTTSPPSQFTLWSYDALYDKWESKPSDPTMSGVSSVSFGASVVVDDSALAYYYGGWLSNASVLGWDGDPVAQPGLLIYDMIANTWQNNSFYDSTPRAEGVMFYIPASDEGMIVYFGGVQNLNGTYIGSPMNQIYLYDIASQKSYLQYTTGEAPGMRRRFCGGVEWADDQSSYNIYFYGGLQPPNEEGYGYGDVWILSIPSFTWTKWYHSEAYAHHSLTCNVVDNSQMIIMGGYFPNSSIIDCDSKSIWGQHNLNLGDNDPASTEWYGFEPTLTTYQVPQTIYGAIGGGPTGGATVTSPAKGWATMDLEAYFGRKYTATVRTATRDVSGHNATSTSSTKQPSSRTNVGAIAGAVVGGVIILLAVLCITLYCLRRRHKKRQTGNEDPKTKFHSQSPAGIVGRPQQSRNVSGVSEMPASSVHEAPALPGKTGEVGQISEVPGSTPQDSPALAPTRVQSPPVPDDRFSFHTRSPPPQFSPHANGTWPVPSPTHSHASHATNWTPVPVYYVPAQQPGHPGYYVQQPPQQQYFPPPPPLHHEQWQPSPTYEMDSISRQGEISAQGSQDPLVEKAELETRQ